MEEKTLRMETAADPIDSEVMTLRIEGDLDSSSTIMLSDIVDKIIAENRRFVIADLTGTTSMCSAALGEFMGCRKRLADRGGDLVLTGLNRDIRSKLTLMGANKVFSFYQDVRSAMHAYKWQYKNMSETVSLVFPSNLKLVPPVRQLASRLAKQKGYSGRDAFRIETIVDEICNNAVEHGKDGQGLDVSMKVIIDKDKVEVDVTNVSDPSKVSALRALLKPAAQSVHSGSDQKRGRGLALIRMLSNDMAVDINDNGTSVRVTKLREE
ncbi:MAG: ATP-binding protein [Chitinispirillaceae bacterium]